MFDDSNLKINLNKISPRIKDISNELFSDTKRVCDTANRVRQQLDVIMDIKNASPAQVRSILEHGHDLIDEIMLLANAYRTKLINRRCPPHKVVIINEIYASTIRRINKQRNNIK